LAGVNLIEELTRERDEARGERKWLVALVEEVRGQRDEARQTLQAARAKLLENEMMDARTLGIVVDERDAALAALRELHGSVWAEDDDRIDAALIVAKELLPDAPEGEADERV